MSEDISMQFKGINHEPESAFQPKLDEAQLVLLWSKQAKP